MITDPVPRARERKASYQRSDELRAIDLVPAGPWRTLADELQRALATESRTDVQRICAALARSMAESFAVPPPPVKVLGVRPHRTDGRVCIYEKFGDYDLRSSHIRLWMRTAMRQKVTSYGTLLNTLCHEICHHLDIVKFTFPDTPHTRGFYERAAALYHHARGTPPRRLVWTPLPRGMYRIDWAKTMKSPMA